MRVKLDPAVLADPARFGRNVSAIIDGCARGRDEWVIDDLDEVIDSAWIRGAATWDASRELAEKTFRAAIDEDPSRAARLIMVVPTAAADAPWVGGVIQCSAEDARRLLERPLYLVLENATSDWSFIRALVTSFDRTRLAQAIDHHWLVPDQAGGSGELVKRAQALIDQGNAAWRVAVMMDSDRLAPGPLPEATEKRVARLQELRVTAIVLHKREVENYLPGSLLDRRSTHDTYVSWRSLSRAQQDHYDMKYGFGADSATGNATIHPAQRELYDGSNPWHLKRLTQGFGKTVGDAFTGVQLDLDELAQVCETRPGELEALLDQLEEWL